MFGIIIYLGFVCFSLYSVTLSLAFNAVIYFENKNHRKINVRNYSSEVAKLWGTNHMQLFDMYCMLAEICWLSTPFLHQN